VGPDAYWDAKDVPKIAIRAGFDTGEAFPHLRWERLNPDGTRTSDEMPFEVTPDGVARRYVINLAAHDGYRGFITRISILPRANDLSAKRVVVERIEGLAE